MLKFEEEFPNLKIYNINLVNRGKELIAIKKSTDDFFEDYGGVSKEVLINIKQSELSLLDTMLRNIQKYCLDKKRVENIMNNLQDLMIGKAGTNLAIYDLIEEKKKELGL